MPILSTTPSERNKFATALPEEQGFAAPVPLSALARADWLKGWSGSQHILHRTEHRLTGDLEAGRYDIQRRREAAKAKCQLKL